MFRRVEYFISCTHLQHDVFLAVDSLTQRVSQMYNRICNTVDSPSGDPEVEPEVANGTIETTGGRGATTGAPTWGTDQVVTCLLYTSDAADE